MAIWGCGSPACCCQAAVAGGFIYSDLWGDLSTHLALQALFIQSSPGHNRHYYIFPLSKLTVRGDTAPAFSGLCVYLQFTWEVGLPTTFTSFPAPDCWVCAATPAFSGPACCEEFPFPPPSVLSASRPLCLLFHFFSFSPWVGVGLSRGLCWSGPGSSVGVPCTA
jgi:hypothetical protein